MRVATAKMAGADRSVNSYRPLPKRSFSRKEHVMAIGQSIGILPPLPVIRDVFWSTIHEYRIESRH
jgi:hypothetical protein